MRDFSKELIVKTSVSTTVKGKNIFIPENATNGDVIKAIFPNFHTDELSHTVWVGYDDMSFRREWWNAPYKGVE